MQFAFSFDAPQAPMFEAKISSYAAIYMSQGIYYILQLHCYARIYLACSKMCASLVLCK